MSRWQEKLGRFLPWGVFGENVTVASMQLEDEVAIGDRLGIDSAEFVVARPRLHLLQARDPLQRRSNGEALPRLGT
jgi:hypothetical protein